MIKEITLDTGPISLYLMEDASVKINILFEKIARGEIISHVVPPVISEVYKNICVHRGKVIAQSSVVTILNDYPIQVVDMAASLLFKAGSLKCSYRDVLSYTDCFVVAHALLNHFEIHTTDKKIPDIPNIKIVKYNFDDAQKYDHSGLNGP